MCYLVAYRMDTNTEAVPVDDHVIDSPLADLNKYSPCGAVALTPPSAGTCISHLRFEVADLNVTVVAVSDEM
jgi:hypothetical protein